MKRLLVVGVLILFVSFNIFGKRVHAYKIKLTSVELNNELRGSIDNNNNQLDLINALFSDSLINVEWTLEPTHLAMNLANESDRNIKIIWDDVTYIDQNSFSQRTMHTSRMIDDIDAVQLSTIVVKKSKIKDNIVPIENLKWLITPVSGRWTFDNLFTDECNGKVRIMLPIEIGSVRYEYLFSFDITRDSRKLKTEYTDTSLMVYKSL
ncbi:hypothetical protein [Ancylomarina sp. 16SWW S1-10-2]|uniref:hypothetical protein n=1 Tax=Ancylomarina sp. 16SWW S1-10-2 TaxID=2499681 RepID=UPI0012AEAB04|nr:hypothetical protein [Ancylomarina sp. 16SWW S1-10-2]MRT91707.1 hypothetical protein [Ancylomarina sp. 16SWW S1-10-2]